MDWCNGAHVCVPVCMSVWGGQVINWWATINVQVTGLSRLEQESHF